MKFLLTHLLKRRCQVRLRFTLFAVQALLNEILFEWLPQEPIYRRKKQLTSYCVVVWQFVLCIHKMRAYSCRPNFVLCYSVVVLLRPCLGLVTAVCMKPVWILGDLWRKACCWVCVLEYPFLIILLNRQKFTFIIAFFEFFWNTCWISFCMHSSPPQVNLKSSICKLPC